MSDKAHCVHYRNLHANLALYPGVETNVSYHSNVADTNHCSWKTEYNDLLTRNPSRFLKHETAKTGDILVGSGGSLKASDWKDWTSPTLTDDLHANWVLD